MGFASTINRNVSVCALANGGYAIAYETNGWAAGTVDISVQTRDSTGVFVNETNITDPTFANDGSDDANPYITQLANGMLAVAYGDNTIGFGDTDTRVLLLDSSTLSVLAERNILAGQSITDDVDNPAIAGYGYGQVAVIHANGTDADIQGEALQAVRTSTGDGLNNTINGDDLVDKINSGAGNDTLRGFANKDILNGGAGIDTLVGGTQSDRLNGGSGSDTLTGNSGSDKFIFKNGLGASNVDTITDFTVPDDTILLDNAIFAGLALGALAPAAFRIGAAAGDGSDRIIYNAATGALYFDANGIGGAAQIQFAQIDPGLALTAADFIVI
jgi:Ca2+-binding RTX toxin-like protein